MENLNDKIAKAQEQASKEKAIKCAREIDDVLKKNGMVLYPIIEYGQNGIVPKVSLKEDDRPKDRQGNGEGGDSRAVAGKAVRKRPA